LKEKGDVDLILQYLENKMLMAARELRFEDAAYLRDRIIEIKADYKIES
jgi:excinuclease UvrABC nuclease subunit